MMASMLMTPTHGAVVALLLLAACVEATPVQPSADNDALEAFTAVFRAWNPTVNEKVRFGRTQYGTGVIVDKAHGAVTDKEPVMAVPMRLVVSLEMLKQKPYGSIVVSPSVQEEDSLALGVLVENGLGNRSELAAWLRVLPRVGAELSPPHTWPRRERDAIEPRSYQHDAQRTADDMKNAYASLRQRTRAIQNAIQYVRGQTSDKSFDITEADFMWARALLDTRAWNVNGRKYFIPGPDMFNHAPDQEDRKYDPTKRPRQQPRSQKFVHYHRVDVRDAKVSGISEPAAVVLSDRSGVTRDNELFESYGDNTDFIYFNYHGFVPSTPEDFVPQNRSVSSREERKVLAENWLAEREKRNRWDSQTMLLRALGWRPVPESAKGEARAALIARLQNGTLAPPAPPKTKGESAKRDSAAEAQHRLLHDWLASRLPNGRVQSTQLFLGEADYVLRLFHTVTVLPEYVVKSACFKNAAAKYTDPSAVDTFRKFYKSLLRNVLACAHQRAPSSADDDGDAATAGISKHAWYVAGLRAAKAAILQQLVATEFPAHGIDTDADVELIRAAQRTLKDASSTHAERQNAAIHVTRGRMALQRRMLIRDVLRRIEESIKRSKAKLVPLVSERVVTGSPEASARDEL
jgi:hypothetical protein